jgi:apolipoprotein N-acyltransferase
VAGGEGGRSPLTRRLGRGVWGVALPVASGLLLAVALPPRPYPGVVWAALVPLLLVLREVAGWRAFLAAWGSGSLYYLLSVYWVGATMELYGHLPSWLSGGVTLLLAIYMGLFVGAWGWLASGILRRSRWLAPLWLGVAWSGLEWVRGHLFGGFGWAHLGYTQVTTPAILQVADLVGVYGLSCIIVAVNAALVATVRRLATGIRPYTVDPQLLAAVIVVIACAAYGQYRLAAIGAAPVVEHLPVALIQGNIPEGEKWDPGKRREIFYAYMEATRREAIGDARAVIWPEAALPYLLQGDPTLGAMLGSVATRAGIDLLLGGLYRAEDDVYRNSAFVISGRRAKTERYDKTYLVPFGEYVPLGPLLTFVRSITAEIGDFQPGHDPQPLDVAGRRAGCAICFEVSYPELIRTFARRGAEWLVGITNDAWFGTSIAPRQHLYIAATRCAEHHLPMARCANTGITALIGPDGAITQEIPQFQRATLEGTVPIRDLGRTVYSHIGEWWFAPLLVLWVALELRARILNRAPAAAAYSTTRSRVPPPRSRSPVNRATVWPGEGARTGSSKRMCRSPPAVGVRVAAAARWVERIWAVTLPSPGGSASQLRSVTSTSRW